MDELISAERFQRLLTAAVVPHHLLYLGFALGESEVHLRALIKRLATELDDTRQHWLPLGESQIHRRRGDLKFFEEMGTLRSFLTTTNAVTQRSCRSRSRSLHEPTTGPWTSTSMSDSLGSNPCA